MSPPAPALRHPSTARTEPAPDEALDYGPARALLTATGPEPALQDLLRFTSRLLHVPIAFVSVFDGAHERVKCAVGRPMDGAPLDTGTESALSRPVRSVVRTGSDFVLADASGDADLDGAGWGAVLAVPLVVRGRPFGCLAVVAADPRCWLPREVESLVELAALLLGTANEIGGRRALTRALGHSEQRYRALIEHSSEGMWCCEFDEPIPVDLPVDQQIELAYESGVLVECNDALAAMYGAPGAADMLGARLDELLPRDEPVNIEMLAGLVAKGYRLTDIESHELDRTGGQRFFHNNMIGVVEAGQLVRVWGTQQDITERHKLEEQLRQAQKMEAVGRLAGGVAHDFNNLLTAIQGHASLALDGAAAGEEIADELREIQRAAECATSLTRQLLAFSRKQVLHPRVLDLNVVVAGMQRMLARLIGEDIDLTTRFQPDLGCVRADAGQIEQVILNLAVNARDAMPTGGRLSIETVEVAFGERLARRHSLPPGRYARLSVRDTGTGMDRNTLAHVFEPFFTTKPTGTGLGLATVYGIVEQSGGHITAYSEPEHGTVFKIYLPIVVCAQPAPAESKTPPPVESVVKGETILLVEDEAGVRAVARKTLRIKGYNVLEAENGAHALELARSFSSRIDLLLTDVVMPGISGTQLAATLMADRPDLRVIFMSGYTDDDVFRAGAPSGDVHFIEKPFTPHSLARQVRQVLDAARQPGEPPLSILTRG